MIIFLRQLTSIVDCQLFLSRHTARTICLIRIAHSSVRQFNEHIVWVGRMRWAHWQPQNNIDILTTTQTTCAAINSLPRSKVENMIVKFKKPIEGIRGKIRLEDGFYIRKLHGKYVVQRCPNRKGHVATEKERENQQRFADRFAVRS